MDRMNGQFHPLERNPSARLDQAGRGMTSAQSSFLQRRFFVFLQSLDGYGFQADPSGRVLFQNVPHVLLGQDKQVAIADRADGSCPTIT